MGEIPRPFTGALVADRSGVTTPYAPYDLQQRGELLVGAGTEVNESMITAETSRRKRSRRQRRAPMRRSASSRPGVEHGAGHRLYCEHRLRGRHTARAAVAEENPSGKPSARNKALPVDGRDTESAVET